MNWFKKKTREEQIDKRVESVLAELTSDVEFEFTDLETVQVINAVRRRLYDILESKKDSFYEQSTVASQNANEVISAIEYL